MEILHCLREVSADNPLCKDRMFSSSELLPQPQRRLNVGPETRDTVTKAYEFALQHVGQDKDSAELWSEYIQFVKSGQTSSTWEEQQKMDALRKIYQRAVQIPLENVEILWKDYEAFENMLNKITVRI